MTGYGAADFLREQQEKKRKEEKYRMENFNPDNPPDCPECGKPMELDPGDGCVHERQWFCPHAGCHYNDRIFQTVALVVGVKSLQEGATQQEVREKIDEIYRRDSR